MWYDVVDEGVQSIDVGLLEGGVQGDVAIWVIAV